MVLPLVPASAFFAAPAILSHSTTQTRSKGCGKPVPCDVELGISNYTSIISESGATPRKYLLHVPVSYQIDVSVPLILSYHGRTKNAENQEQLSQFSNISYGFEGISVYPEGVPSDKGSLQWQGDPDSHGIDDVAFTMEILDEVLDAFCVDTSRIYAAGKSNGGGFTGLLACDANATKRIAAFAPVSGAYYLDEDTQELPPCNPTENREIIPILEFHGWLDRTIEYEGGPNDRDNGNTTNIPEWVDGWAKRNGFDVDANKTEFLCSGKKKVTKYSWNDTVVHYNVSNYKHWWPTEYGNVDTAITTCADADATTVILDWFSKWNL